VKIDEVEMIKDERILTWIAIGQYRSDAVEIPQLSLVRRVLREFELGTELTLAEKNDALHLYALLGIVVRKR
jgi:hypothetical protein